MFVGFLAGALFGQDRRDAARETPDSRLENATMAIKDIMSSPDKGIPQDLMAKAQCVVVIPDLLKGAFVIGGQYGRGYATCRNGDGWSGPAAVRIEGGSFGFQLGGSATDLVMLVMNREGIDRLLSDKFTIGGEASAAAGPVGRQTSAQTDIALHAQILTWSRSRGVFAGISLNGATLRPDSGEDKRLYGKDVTNREILNGEVPPAPAGRQFVAEISRSARAGEAAEARRENTPAPESQPSTEPMRAQLNAKPIHFARGQVAVAQEAEPVLLQVAQTLQQNPSWKIRIEGFTDNTGTKAQNQKVSRQRADAVLNWLAGHGVDRSRMRAVGRGEAQPVADNSTEPGRNENRRVEIVRSDNLMNRTGL